VRVCVCFARVAWVCCELLFGRERFRGALLNIGGELPPDIRVPSGVRSCDRCDQCMYLRIYHSRPYRLRRSTPQDRIARSVLLGAS